MRPQPVPSLSRFHHPFVLFLALMVVAGAQLAQALTMGNVHPPDQEFLLGPDSYMRLARVELLAQTGVWYDPVFPFTNAPFGEELHWTRPMDLLILAGAWLLSWVMEWRNALVLWASLVSPVLCMITVIFLSWGTRPFLSNIGLVMLAGTLALQIELLFQLGWARPDHHGLQLMLLAAQMAFLFRLLHGPGRSFDAYGAGTMAGLAIWVSVEALAQIFVALSALGLLWVWRDRRHLETVARYTTAMAVTSAVALALERAPAFWLQEEYDRISIVHVSLFFVMAMAAGGLAKIAHGTDLSSRNRRLRWSIAAVFLPAAFLLMLFPKFFHGPFVDMDPRVFAVFIDNNVEFLPALKRRSGPITLMLMHYFGLLLPTVPFLLYRLAKGEERERQLAVYFLLGLIIFVPLTLYQVRWAPYVQLFAVVPLTVLALSVWRWAWDGPLARGNGVLFSVLPRLAPFVIIFAGHEIVEGVLVRATVDPKNIERPFLCDWRKMAEYLRDPTFTGGRKLTLMTFIFPGPEVHFRSGHRVVAGPYGNASSILDTHAFMIAGDDDTSRSIARARRIDAVVFCQLSTDAETAAKAEGDGLFKRLRRGEEPDWLEPVSLPAELKNGFSVFRVVEP